MGSLYETAGQYICRNNDITTLPFQDRSVLLLTAAENISCLIAVFTAYYSHLYQHRTIMNLYGIQQGRMLRDSHYFSSTKTPNDLVLCKLAVSLFAFSSNARTLHEDSRVEYAHPDKVLAIQHKYAEVTWKYLIYKYGHYEAVLRFMLLIEWFLSISTFVSYARQVTAHVNDIESLVEQTEVELIINGVENGT